MGATNVLRAFVAAEGIDLPAPARLILVRMAVTAKDDDEPPRYFAGWETLAHAIGYPLPDVAEGMPRRESARRHVRRLVKQLETQGLISRYGRAHTGRNAEYHLHLALRLGATASPSLGKRAGGVADLSDPPVGDASDPSSGGSQMVGLADSSDPPKEYEEPGTGDISGISGISRSTSPGRAAAIANAEIERVEREYEEARARLNAMGPEHAQDAIADVRRNFPDLSTREAVLAAANNIRRPGAA